ncbi:MAG: hypothetical protein KDE53_21065 [Caldilineaceae bacterium]|nr:hypothetical protein [Caldilineaceae bacterium]MCB0128852.1 hypothetical protein [Caldilineaceae bacterium]
MTDFNAIVASGGGFCQSLRSPPNDGGNAARKATKTATGAQVLLGKLRAFA